MTDKEGEIQLVIKAPSQNVEDHIVQCNLDWTVGELKEYLSDEYPTKPDVLEQRLIYSGHLLHNHLYLRDILRHSDGEPTVHTVHLVCNSNKHMHNSQRSTSSQNWCNQATAQTHMTNTGTPGSSPESILRHRNDSFFPPMNSVYSPFQPPSSVVPPSGDAQVLAQMTAMQQMYTYYINQYMQSINTTAVPVNGSVFPEPSNFQPSHHIPNEVPVHQQGNQRIVAQGGQVIEENDEMANRDWLDHLFLCSRFLILFCIVYFYSTPERLMIVIVFAVIAFLYHEGWFMRRARPIPAVGDAHVPPNEINNENEPPILVNQDLSANEGQQDGHELEAAMDGDNPPHVQNADVVNNNQNWTPLTFLSAFFSSLIPEPPPPVNIN